MPHPTLCLTMIVKNEAHVIRRCLAGVRPLIDAWLIVDTGSTDGTQQIIREYLADLPGALLERPWVDFSTNRNQAIEAARARADYLLIMDADEVVEDGAVLPAVLDRSGYEATCFNGSVAYNVMRLIDTRQPWHYVGVLHEVLVCPGPWDVGFLEGLRVISRCDGARSQDPIKYRRDALVLEQALLSEPNNARHVFYLAQSYRDCGELELAVRHYRRRAAMGGWDEEVWYAQFQVAELMARLDRPWPEVLVEFLAAFELRPQRAEPLFRIGVHYQQARQYATAATFLARAAAIPYPAADRLFVEPSPYRYLIGLELAVSNYWLGDHATAIQLNNHLLSTGQLPVELVEQVTANRRYSLDLVHPRRGEPLVQPHRLLVVVGYDHTGVSSLRACIDSVLCQDFPGFELLLVEDGAAQPALPPDLLADPRIRLVRQLERQGLAQAVVAALADEQTPETIVVVLDAGDRLLETCALSLVDALFRYGTAEALYSQFVDARGALGHALPFADPGAFAAREPQTYRPGLKAWRARLTGAVTGLSRQDGLEILFDRIIGEAGFQATDFSDDVLCQRLGYSASGQGSP